MTEIFFAFFHFVEILTDGAKALAVKPSVSDVSEGSGPKWTSTHCIAQHGAFGFT